MPSSSHIRPVVVALFVAVGAAVLAAGAAARPSLPEATTTVRVTFTGSGGGRYLDVTRWLEDSTRECYARKVADETLSVSWTLAWNVTLLQRGQQLELRSAKPVQRSIQGSVRGDAVRDFCDEPEQGPEDVGADWPGTTQCDGPMEIVSRGVVSLAKGPNANLLLRGPQFGSPPNPCELDVRNDQLATAVPLAIRTVRNLASSAAKVTIPVGTKHPTPRIPYQATRLCSQFPHIYDGIVYLYDCEDTLAWDGTVTLTRLK